MTNNTTFNLRKRYAKYKNQRLNFKLNDLNNYFDIYGVDHQAYVSGIFCDIKSMLSSTGNPKKITLFFRGVCLTFKGQRYYLNSPTNPRKLIVSFRVPHGIFDFSWENLKEIKLL